MPILYWAFYFLFYIFWHEKRLNHWILEQKSMLKLTIHVDMAMGFRAVSWNCFGKSKVIFFRPWISRETEMFQLHFYICLKNLSNPSCLAMRLPRGPLGGLCWEVQNQLLKLLFSSLVPSTKSCHTVSLSCCQHVMFSSFQVLYCPSFRMNLKRF